uniref:Uncharacterized LOC115376289 n=1 Tax=Myripristis murdjan TaxID=586833 RepID=A0A667ZJ03_9TELE
MSLVFLLHLAELKLSLSLRQDSGFLSANVGDNMTLKCFYEGDVAAMFYWYKQTLGQKPLLMCSFYKYEKNAIFHNEFKNDPRFKLEIETNGNQLKIFELQHSDAATYFCVNGLSFDFEFGDGVTLSSESYEVASPPVLVYFLSAALAFTITLVVLLASSVYETNKINSRRCTDSQARSSTASTQHVEGQDADNLHYAALSENKAHRPRRQRDNTDTVCVYSSIK